MSLYALRPLIQAAMSGSVPNARTLTINGTTFDLSANRSWSVGTVTGSGTSGYMPYWSGATALGNSPAYTDGTSVILGSTTAVSLLTLLETSTSALRGISSQQRSSDTNGSRLNLLKARGSGSNTVISSGDVLGSMNGWGYDGTQFLRMAAIDFISSGTIATNRVPTEIRFHTATDASTSVLTERARFDNAGRLLVGFTTSQSSVAFNQISTGLYVGDGKVYLSSSQPTGTTIKWQTGGVVFSPHVSLGQFIFSGRLYIDHGATGSTSPSAGSGNNPGAAITLESYTYATSGGANDYNAFTGALTVNQSGGTGNYVIFNYNVVETAVLGTNPRWINFTIGGADKFVVKSSGAPKFANIAASKVVFNDSNGYLAALTLGSGLSLSGSTLNTVYGNVVASDSKDAQNTNQVGADYSTTDSGAFEVGGFFALLAGTIGTIHFYVDYTDENGAGQTEDFWANGASTSGIGTVGNFPCCSMTIRATVGSSTHIKVKADVTGIVSYDMASWIRKI